MKISSPRYVSVLLVPALMSCCIVSAWGVSQPGTTPPDESGGPQPGTVVPTPLPAPLPSPGYPIQPPPPPPAPVKPPKPPKRAIPPAVKMPGPSMEIGFGSYYNSISINAPVDYAWRWQFNPYGVVINGASRVGDWGGTAGISLSIRNDGKADIDTYSGTRAGEALRKNHTTFDAPLLSRLTKITEKNYNIDRKTEANQSEIVQFKPNDERRLRTPIYIQINRVADKGKTEYKDVNDKK